jgi:hypothetical protein
MSAPQLECLDCMTAAATGVQQFFRAGCAGCADRALAALTREVSVADLRDPLWMDTLPVQVDARQVPAA